MEHLNFYENIREAEMRLVHTIVLYDDEPYYVLAICDHKKDGIFRMYLDPLGENGMVSHRLHVPYEWYQETPDGPTRGDKMDEFLNKNPNCGILRKMMNSPAFNRFRPFPLGMSNIDGRAFYLERSPVRHTQQGLTTNMIDVSAVDFEKNKYRAGISVNTPGLYHTIKGNYPSIYSCIENLHDPKITNDSASFNRNFALLRGPVGLLFLAYKTDIIGFLTNGDLSEVRLGKDFQHTKEVVAELGVFNNINF